MAFTLKEIFVIFQRALCFAGHVHGLFLKSILTRKKSFCIIRFSSFPKYLKMRTHITQHDTRRMYLFNLMVQIKGFLLKQISLIFAS